LVWQSVSVMGLRWRLTSAWVLSWVLAIGSESRWRSMLASGWQ
jgi:hypothetical protein